MTKELEESLASLSPIQRDAVTWGEGAALILAGPGAGKTRVLTTRVARLLHETPTKKFRILALTFTTKAAAEMHERIEKLVPGIAESRTFIGTFHAFSTQILRQHGSHVGIQPDFAIVDQRADREALLHDALHDAIRGGQGFSPDDIQWLDAIDEMKARLVTPEKAATRISNPHMSRVYELYEAKLKAENVMDFNGLIFDACRLLAQVPAVAARIRNSYPYWMIDEFQDTSLAQYWLIHYLAGGTFKNIFAVADDDQIIYGWAGASYRRIEKFREDHKPTLIQLVENHRCPPEIVGIANRLVAHNTQRAPEKKPTVPARTARFGAISVREFETDVVEREALSDEILALGQEAWGKIAILGRTRTLLQPMLASLAARGVKAALLQRRDSFISPQFVWLQSCLELVLRPSNKRLFAILVNAANRVAGVELDPAVLIAESEAGGRSFLEHWSSAIVASDSAVGKKMGALVAPIAHSRDDWKIFVRLAIPLLLETGVVAEGAVSDVADDHNAWNSCAKEIRLELGKEPDLSQLMQGLALRSKEPPRDPHSVSLLTVHASKGLEFDFVYVIGLAEREMPSWQSVDKGDTSPEMEEERRNCFVAITRTREKLTLSRAKNYRNWNRQPSRFLREMSLLS